MFTTFECSPETCTLSSYKSAENGGALFALENPDVVEFTRSSFDRCAAVRVSKEGKVTKTTNMKRRQMRKLGYSYTVLYTPEVGSELRKELDAKSEERGGKIQEELVISRGNLGKRTSRERVSVLNQKMRR
jgi:hypothetical protein